MTLLTVTEALRSVEGALGASLPKTLIQRLKTDPEFRGYRDGVSLLEDVVDMVGRWRAEFDLTRQQAGESTVGTEAESAYRRARSMVEYKLAQRNPAVQAFRAQHLRELLDADDVGPWIARQAKVDGPPTRFATVPLPDDWDRGDPVPQIPAVLYEVRTLTYPSEDDWAANVSVRSDGVLGELLRISEGLAFAHGWHPGQATSFVLADTVPLISTLAVTSPAAAGKLPGPVTLKASIETSEESLILAFRRAREKQLGRRHRALDRKSVGEGTSVVERG